MTKRPSFGIFNHNQHEFVGWLQMLSPTPICEGARFKQVSGFSACCQLHAVVDCLDHADGDSMAEDDKVTCEIAVEYLKDGKGVAANGIRTLPPNWNIENEVEH